MTTLADLTLEQRQQCVGMWAQCTECEELESGLSIIDTIFENDALLLGPNVHPHTVELANVTPLPELLRAWNPDGTPPAGRREDTP